MQQRKPIFRSVLAASAAASVIFASAAQADENSDQSSKGWDITVGAGAASMPKYPGSDQQRTRALPYVNISYGRYFFGGESTAGVGGIGAYLYQDAHWRIGAAVSPGGGFKERKESDDPRLRGLGNIDATTRVGGFASYTLDWLTASASLSTDVGGNRQGTVATLGVTARWQPIDRLTVNAGPSVTWSNSEYMQTFFGIDALQALRSGRPQYRAGGGVSSVGLSASAHYRLNDHWGVGAFVSASRLQGDAKDSPITQDKAQNVFGAFSTYHF